MDLTPEQKVEIENIMASMDCPCDFECYKSGFNSLCKAEYHGLGEFATCLEKDQTTCIFRVAFGLGAFCTCPLRVHIAKKLKK